MENPIVTITDGQLKGITGTNIDDEKFYSFLGVPFGKAPVGELRFKAPLPAEPWEGIRDATKEGEQCLQRGAEPGSFVFKGYLGSEDCLFLNVFTKTLPSEENKLKPVMVYIHGGAFVMGSGSAAVYGPKILMTEDIVLVIINYRIGALGFLSLKDTSLGVPGNAGLKDQTLALKWVQKNIKFFNGDPNNVTIFGESAGGASVHYQILSSSAKGLFHKAIVQSGTSLSAWAYSDPNVLNFVKYLGISDITNEKEVLEKLIALPAEDILKAQDSFCDENGKMIGLFAPVIEKPNDTEFISKDPIEIIQSGEYNKVPVVFGYTSNEGLLLQFMKVMSKLQEKPFKESKLEDLIPWQVELAEGSDEKKLAVSKLKEFYECDEHKENPYLMATDSLFVASTIAAINNQIKVQQEPIYLYRMSVVTERNFLSKRLKVDTKLGVCHGDDLGYLFDSAMMPYVITKGSPEDIGIRRFVKLWTNFAKHGNPTPSQEELGVLWKAVEINSRNFLDIGDDLIMETNPEYERMELWKEIFQMNSRTAPFLQ